MLSPPALEFPSAAYTSTTPEGTPGGSRKVSTEMTAPEATTLLPFRLTACSATRASPAPPSGPRTSTSASDSCQPPEVSRVATETTPWWVIRTSADRSGPSAPSGSVMELVNCDNTLFLHGIARRHHGADHCEG